MTVAYDFSTTPDSLMIILSVLFLAWLIFAIKTCVYYSKHPGLRKDEFIVLLFLVPLVCLVTMGAGFETAFSESFKKNVVTSFENKPVAAKIFLLENEIKTRRENISHATKKRFMSRQDVEMGAAHVASMTEEELARRLRDAREAHAVLLDVPETDTTPRD